MGLADQLEAFNNETIKRRQCPYKTLLESMSKEDLQALQEAIDKGYSMNVILRALRAEGYKTSNEALSAHKKGRCSCAKK